MFVCFLILLSPRQLWSSIHYLMEPRAQPRHPSRKHLPKVLSLSPPENILPLTPSQSWVLMPYKPLLLYTPGRTILDHRNSPLWSSPTLQAHLK